MRIQVKPIGYKFRVTNDAGVFDVTSTTELSMSKSEEIIRKFFDNFEILKSDIRIKPTDVAIAVRSKAKHVKETVRYPVRHGAKLTDSMVRSGEKKPARFVEKEKSTVQPEIRSLEKNFAKSMVRSTEKAMNSIMRSNRRIGTSDRIEPKLTAGLAEKRVKIKDMWKKLRGLVNDEFTLQDYVKSLRVSGYKYTKSSWEAVPSQQLTRLVEIGEIERIGNKRPYKFRKIKVSTSLRSEKSRELLKI